MPDERIDVVLVDDEPDVRFVVGRHLELSGRFAVVGEGTTGNDAVTLARELRPRLMLLDVSMPEVGGLEALPEVRAASPGTTVVILTALSRDGLEQSARARGAAGLIVKGGAMSQLAPTLLEVLTVEEHQPTLAELADANAQLRAAAEQTAQFVALTAHELRSPITAITGAAEILRTYWDDLDVAEREESLDSILRGGQRIRRLLDDLILVSRLEAQSFDFRLEDVPLLSILDEAVAEVSDVVREVTITCDEPFVVRADRIRLCQIVTNLVTNASRHGRPPIEVDAVGRGRVVEVRVRDAGPGVPEGMVPRLFDKFVKGPAGGSGLGLFIVRELVAGQGGRTWYERDERGRSCFGFSLPLVGA